jgi:hypothetical protein
LLAYRIKPCFLLQACMRQFPYIPLSTKICLAPHFFAQPQERERNNGPLEAPLMSRH